MLRNIPSAYNYRFKEPAKNIGTEEEARELFQDEYQQFLEQHPKMVAAAGINILISKNEVKKQNCKIFFAAGFSNFFRYFIPVNEFCKSFFLKGW